MPICEIFLNPGILRLTDGFDKRVATRDCVLFRVLTSEARESLVVDCNFDEIRRLDNQTYC